MRALSIIGIILFTWLFLNRFDQYGTNIKALGETITADMIERAKTTLMEQMAVSAFGVIYSIAAIVYFFNKRDTSGSMASKLTALYELKEKGAISVEEYEREKGKLLM